jgi:hypothetical protein
MPWHRAVMLNSKSGHSGGTIGLEGNQVHCAAHALCGKVDFKADLSRLGLKAKK